MWTVDDFRYAVVSPLGRGMTGLVRLVLFALTGAVVLFLVAAAAWGVYHFIDVFVQAARGD
jgi:hypothetical protein